ncbi:MAG: thioredoxin fold domain-containing protein [Nitrospirota bacterium]|nr:MAG: thioredoxin fold domain-containing protein [Nitrospirota bacterium]
MKKVLETRKDIAFHIVLFPLSFHKDAKRKSESIWCERSLDMLEDAFDKKPVPDPACKDDVIDQNIALAGRLGITGTPAIIYSDGRLVSGFINAEKIIELLVNK